MNLDDRKSDFYNCTVLKSGRSPIVSPRECMTHPSRDASTHALRARHAHAANTALTHEQGYMLVKIMPFVSFACAQAEKTLKLESGDFAGHQPQPRPRQSSFAPINWNWKALDDLGKKRQISEDR